MAGLEELALALLGKEAQTEIAGYNPYLQFAGVPQTFSSALTSAPAKSRKELWQNAAAASVGGLLGGALTGMGQNYQTTLTNRYTDAIASALSGKPMSGEGLPSGLFGKAQQAGKLFSVISGIESAQADRQARQDLLKTALVEQLKQKIDIDNAGAKKAAEILAEDAAYRGSSGAQPPAAVVKAATPEPIGSRMDGTLIMAESAPVAEQTTDVIVANPNNPYVKEQMRAAERVQDQVLKLESDTYSRIKGLASGTQFADIDANFRTLKALAKEDSRSASVGMISALARIWDPMGTVREGEYNINSNAQAALDNIIGDWREMVMGKGKLSPTAKRSIISAASQKYNEFGAKYATERAALYNALETQGGKAANIPTPDYVKFDPATLDQIIPDVPPGYKLQRSNLGNYRVVPK